MDLSMLLRYIGGESSAKEVEILEKWLSDDQDGSHADLYKDAHDIYEAMALYPMDPAVETEKKPNFKNRILSATSILAAACALFIIALNAGISIKSRNLERTFDAVQIPVGRSMELCLEDGTRIWLNSEAELSYPKSFGKKERRIILTRGEILMDVTRDPGRPFIVETKQADVKVYGTKFNLNLNASTGTLSTSLMRGLVGITPKVGNKSEIKLVPGQVLTIGPGGNMIWGDFTDEDMIGAWTDGLINISGSDFQVLMNRLEAAFHTTIIIQRKEMPKYDIARGRVRIIDGIDHALDVVKLAADFTYKHDYATDTIIIK